MGNAPSNSELEEGVGGKRLREEDEGHQPFSLAVEEEQAVGRLTQTKEVEQEQASQTDRKAAEAVSSCRHSAARSFEQSPKKQKIQSANLLTEALSAVMPRVLRGGGTVDMDIEGAPAARTLSAGLPRSAVEELQARIGKALVVDAEWGPPLVREDVGWATFHLPNNTDTVRCAHIDLRVQRRMDDLCWPGLKRGYEWGDGARLAALKTDGDGDCLLHAASLGMWGVHDRSITLRQLISQWVINDKVASAFKKAFEEGELSEDQSMGLGLVREQDQLNNQWEKTVVQPAVESKSYLLRFHIYLLAHILRRPIIVYADTCVRDEQGQPYAPLNFRGIYLPSLHGGQVCRYPLIMAYTVPSVGLQGHFTALVGVEGQTDRVPLHDATGALLPIPYTTTLIKDQAQPMEVLQRYMHIEDPTAVAPFACLESTPKMLPETRLLRADLLKETIDRLKASLRDCSALVREEEAAVANLSHSAVAPTSASSRPPLPPPSSSTPSSSAATAIPVTVHTRSNIMSNSQEARERVNRNGMPDLGDDDAVVRTLLAEADPLTPWDAPQPMLRGSSITPAPLSRSRSSNINGGLHSMPPYRRLDSLGSRGFVI